MCDKQKNINEHCNGKLIYEYTKEYVDSKEIGLDRINQKLTVIIGFSAVLIKFAGDLHSTNNIFNILTITKAIAIIVLLISIICSISGLWSKQTAETINPKELEADWWYKEDEKIKLFIIRQWFETGIDLEKEAQIRSKLLNVSFLCIIISSICFCINSIA